MAKKPIVKTKTPPVSKSTKKTLSKPKVVAAKIVDAEIVDSELGDDAALIDTPLETKGFVVEDLPADILDLEIEDSTEIRPKPAKKKSKQQLVPATTGVAGTDPLSMYLAEVRKYPVLSREDELVLAKKYYESKDPILAQQLVKANLRFVVKVAAEYAKFSSRLIDLIQEGNVGLMHAVKEFNPYKGTRLITYAVWWIRGYIQEYLMRQFSMVRIGTTANQRKLFYQLQRQKNEIDKMTSSENVAELAEKLGIPEDEVSDMAQRLSSRDVSLDKPAGDDENATPLSALLKKEDGSLPLDEQLALEEQLGLLLQAIEKVKPALTEKEKILLDERVLSDEPLTLQEIGHKYNISREAVRQNEARLIKRIKDAMIEMVGKTRAVN